jgi:predicted nucleic acid-binding protein
MIVVDVNVVAYLLIEGEHTRQAEALLAADPEWAAPLLWRSEWRNVLAGYLRRGELDPAGAREHLEAATALLNGREHLVDDETVMDLVLGSDCSAYDCEYAALADALHVPLVTFDRRLRDAFPDQAQSVEAFLSGRD